MHFVRYSFLLLSMVFVSTVWGQELSKLDGVLSWRSSAADFYFEKPIKSWKDFRDEGIVKQNLDYSCGAASVATVLNSFYGKNVTEAQLLKAMNKEDARASFEDMARVVQHWGFKAQGFASSWEQLQQLKIPVIVYVRHRSLDHFSVLYGIDGQTVWLADPSQGHRTYSREQFLAMWQTREQAGDGLDGKFLVILPQSKENQNAVINPYLIFNRSPVRQSVAALGQMDFWWRP